MGAQEVTDLESRLRVSKRINLVLAAAIAFLLVVVGVQQMTISAGGAAPTATPSASSTAALAAQVARNQADDPLAWGPLDAPVVMIQWTDFRCPFCASFAKDSLPSLFTDYIDAGKVRFEVHDVAFFGDQSVDASAAVRAAGKQGKAHEYMVAMFDAAPSSGHPDLPTAKLIGFAKTAGVPDLEAFAADLADPAVHQQVVADTTKAQQMGVTSVPYFVIGGQVVSGAQPLENFRAVIDTELANR